MKKKFDYNNDIIVYQNMVNEFEILKKIILDEELLEIMKFISKTSISLNTEIQEKRNEELNLNDLLQKNEFNLLKIIESYPEIIKNYGNNPYIYSKVIKNFFPKIQN